MDIKVTETTGIPPVTVLHLDGKLDGSNHESLTAEVQRLYAAGSRNLLIDMSKLAYISSAGIAALHKTALIFRGVKLSDLQEGWAAFRGIDQDRDSGVQEHVKLLSPTAPVQQVLAMVGFNTLFEVHTDLQQALASFH